MALTYDDLGLRKCLIIHGDDLGMCDSVNQATFVALAAGAITSASAMVPCAWVAQVSEFCRLHPDADIGLHLTLTSECIKYRWRPMSTSAAQTGLTDSTGFMHNSVGALLAHAHTIDDEIHSQRIALDLMGIIPTHIDCHMYAAFKSPLFLSEYVRAAVRSNTLVQVPRSLHSLALRYTGTAPELLPVINIVGAKPSIPSGSWLEFYRKEIEAMPVGLTVLLVHLGYDTEELRAAREGCAGWDSPWRQRDYDTVMSPCFRDTLLHNDVVLLNWRRLSELIHR